MKKLSVSIPTFNRREYLEGKLSAFCNAIIQQRLEQNINVLIVDNASTDYDLAELADSYRSQRYVQFVRNPANIGAGANFLRCIELSDAEFVWLLGDDAGVNYNLLSDLVAAIDDADCYLLQCGPVPASQDSTFSRYTSVSQLLDKFYSLGAFFLLSTYILKRSVSLDFLKVGYESIIYQHPYASMALEMLRVGSEVSLLSIPILSPAHPAVPRYEVVTAYVDIVQAAFSVLTRSQFRIFLNRDFYPFKEHTIYNLDIGITGPISLDAREQAYQRLASILPRFSRAFVKTVMWLFFIRLRRMDHFVAFFVFVMSRLRKRSSTKVTFSSIVKRLRENNTAYSNQRH